MAKRIDVVGAGLSGLYAACYLAKKGHPVSVYEKNEGVGGRSRVFEAEGFKFDMGPSWYWMPELIDKLFEDLGEKREHHFRLKRLHPSYRVFWKHHDPTDIPSEMSELKALFASFEADGDKKLTQFLKDAQKKYEIAVDRFLFQPGLRWRELLSFSALKYGLQLDLFKSVAKDVARRFSSPRARGILNFPVLFLGEMPHRIPSLYTLMNYADLKLGTWYPEGGMGTLAQSLLNIALQNNVQFHFNTTVQSMFCEGGEVKQFDTGEETIDTRQMLFSADYHHVEQELLPKSHRTYSSKYWDSRKLAPSCLIYYLGIDKKVEGLTHHNLFFDEDLTEHGRTIYETPSWPENPLFYVCAPSKTDEEVAPEGQENLFVLIPIAPDLEDNESVRKRYLKTVINRIEKHTHSQLEYHIVYQRSYCVNDFKKDYNAFKGNAYGLANTLMQTANLKPKISSDKLSNLNYCGQLTVPGPGVPPALISGQIAAKHILLNHENHL